MTNIWDYTHLTRVANFDVWYNDDIWTFDFGHTGRHTLEEAVQLFHSETDLLPPGNMTMVYHKHDDSYRYHADTPAQ